MMLAKLTDTSIDQARKQSRKRLLQLLAGKVPQRDMSSIVSDVHSAMCAFERIHRRVTVRVKDIRWQPIANPMAVIEALERLAKRSDYVRAKAFKELPPVAMDVLAAAAEKVTGEPLSKMMAQWPFYPARNILMHVPKRADLMRLLPTAMEMCARDSTSRATRKIERDAAVIAILRAYQTIYSEPLTVQNVRPFIEKVERCYKPLLPVKGLNVKRSANVLQSLIDAVK
jgi:hypothetical protein